MMAKTISLAAILALIGFLIYSVYSFNISQKEQEGFLTCDKDGKICELSSHIHADIKMNVCGEEIIFPKEKGRTDKQHTHKEVNKIHWESSIRVDPKTRKPLDPTPLTVASFLKEMEYSLPKSCPDNVSPKLLMNINGEPNDKVLDYVWKDNDTIEIDYR